MLLRSRRSNRLWVRPLEERLAPAVFDIADGDIPGLIAAINVSNANNQSDIINLATDGTYTFTTAFDTNQGGLGLPEITADSNNVANSLTINGNGATWVRQSSAGFRFALITGGVDGLNLAINQLTFDGAAPGGSGGALFLDDVNYTLTDCTFRNNSASGGGGLVSVGVNNRTGVLNNCLIENNDGENGIGGGMANQGTTQITLNDTKIINNTAEGTGGFWNQSPNVTITMNRCTVSNNTSTGATTGEAGIFMQGDLIFNDGDVSGNTAAFGGGISIQGNLTITNSSLTKNAGTDPVSEGGAIFIQGDLILSNSTVDGNKAGNGGGISLAAGSNIAKITNSTITDNDAFFGLAKGGGILVASGTLSLGNSIIAGNTSADTGPDISGNVTSLGFNIIGVTDGANITGNKTGNLTGTAGNPFDPILQPLADNGGPTLTRAPGAGSPAVDAGDPSFVGPPDTDQRGPGFPRVINRLDIGAVEARQIDLNIIKDDFITTAIPGQGVVYSITVSNLGPVPAMGARVQDILSSQFVGATWQGLLPDGTVLMGTGDIDVLIDLAVGEIATFTIAATIDPSATGFLVNTAQVIPPIGFTDVNGGTVATDTNTLTPVADAQVVKFSTGGPATPGNPITYTIIVSNDGPSTADGILLTDLFPASITSASWTSTATAGASGNTVFGFGDINEVLRLLPLASVTYFITADVSPDAVAGDLVNVATVTVPFTISDPNPDNNTAVDTTKLIVGKQVIVTAPDQGQIPLLRIYNPGSGNLRASFLAYSSGFRGGVRVAVADFNGDGVQDIVTAPGPGGGPHIKIFSGTDFGLMNQYFAYDAGFTGGVYVATGDVNGDGIPDVITGAGAGGGPHVRVFSGITSLTVPGPMSEFFAYDAAFHGGVRVAAGDTNNDKLADVITGAGPGGGPHVVVWNSANRTPRLSFFAYDPGFRGGVYVAAGDLNFDGVVDVVTGAGEGGGAHVRYFDGRNQLPFREFFAFPANTGGVGSNAIWSSGVRVAVMSDINGDGLADLVTAPGAGRSGTVRVFGGALLNQLREITPQDPAFLGGVFVGAG